MFIQRRFLKKRNNWSMFEAGRKNTFAEGMIGQFSYDFREKIRTSLNNGGWDTVSGRSFSWTGARILWTSVARTGGMFLKRAKVERI